MEDTIPKSHENQNETIEEMEERLNYLPPDSPGYAKLSRKIEQFKDLESSENNLVPENSIIPESRLDLDQIQYQNYQNNNVISSTESIDPMLDIQEKLKQDDCDSLASESVSCATMETTSDEGDNLAEYSPLAPSTMNLNQDYSGEVLKRDYESVIMEDETDILTRKVDVKDGEGSFDEEIESYEMVGKR